MLPAQEAVEVGVDGDYRQLRMASGQEVRCVAVLLARGSTYRWLEVPGEDDFVGAGVHFCATRDGVFNRDKRLLVVGGAVVGRGGERGGLRGVFVFIGLTPNSGLVKGLVDLDGQGFVVTDHGLQTSVPGVLAAGDLRAGATKQAASAAGEGAAVALSIRRYLEHCATGARPHTVS